MPEVRLVKKYPHIKDEDVTSIFQEGYIKGFENGRKGAIPIEWIEKYAKRFIELENRNYFAYRGFSDIGEAILNMLENWEKENERP